jgi:glycosyltransferase involved in cell wall biosynthesis
MRVVHVSTFDDIGGAGRAMSGLHRALMGEGIDSRVLVQEKRSADPTVVEATARGILRRHAWRQIADTWPLMFYRKKTVMHWTCGRVGSRIVGRIAAFHADIVHLHWIGRGFLSVNEIGALRGPVVWTLHDSWAFTGGCHVPFACTRYRERCGACPQLGSRIERDISRATWERKQRAWRDLKLTVVTPSRWLAACAGASSLFRDRRIVTIPNGVDHRVFYPEDRAAARIALGLPLDRRIILFGAMHADRDRNKGLHLLKAALASRAWDADLVIFGASSPRASADLGLRTHSRGIVSDFSELRRLYNAADVLALPSIQENYPNMILESMACGTPVVAFDAGGIPEMIEPGITGFLARAHDPRALAEAIAAALELGRAMRAACRAAIERACTSEHMARAYRELYEEALI